MDRRKRHLGDIPKWNNYVNSLSLRNINPKTLSSFLSFNFLEDFCKAI